MTKLFITPILPCAPTAYAAVLWARSLFPVHGKGTSHTIRPSVAYRSLFYPGAFLRWFHANEKGVQHDNEKPRRAGPAGLLI
jgi:hypothetical protein